MSAVIARMDDRPIDPELPPPPIAADALDRSARLQLVKCSVNDGGRGNPRPSMVSNCGSTYLNGDLELLRPNAIIAVHGDVRGELWNLYRPKYAEAEVPGLSWGKLEIESRSVPFFATYHPSAGQWHRSWERLTATLDRLGTDLKPLP